MDKSDKTVAQRVGIRRMNKGAGMNGISLASRPLRRLCMTLLTVATSCLALPAVAQNPFSVAVRVDDAVITNYEITQRMMFLEVLNAQGDVRQQATEALINERLQVTAALGLGVAASPDDIETGLNEFAARANLSPEAFLSQMGQQGIAPETVRDFVANGITWRNMVRARFAGQAQIDDTDVERALEFGTLLGGGIEILMAEIIIPITPENQATLVEELGRLGQQLNGDAEQFTAAAGRFSAAPTRESGGLTGWRALRQLPEGLRERFQNMGYGQVTEPIPLGGGQAYALFQFRGQREVEAPRLPVVSIDYVSIAIPGGRSAEALEQAARLDNAVDVCNDFNGVIPGGFTLHSVAPQDLPSDVALALRTLDNGEMTTSVTRNDGTVLYALMLCDRVTSEPEAGFAGVRDALFGQRLTALADGYLEQLRAEARITREN